MGATFHGGVPCWGDEWPWSPLVVSLETGDLTSDARQSYQPRLVSG